MLSCCFLDFSVGVGAFVTGLSQISSFFSCKTHEFHMWQIGCLLDKSMEFTRITGWFPWGFKIWQEVRIKHLLAYGIWCWWLFVLNHLLLFVLNHLLLFVLYHLMLFVLYHPLLFVLHHFLLFVLNHLLLFVLYHLMLFVLYHLMLFVLYHPLLFVLHHPLLFVLYHLLLFVLNHLL